MAMQLALQLALQLTLQLAVKLMELDLTLNIKLAMQLSSVVRRLRTTDEGENSENLETDVFGHGEKIRRILEFSDKTSNFPTRFCTRKSLDLKWLCSWLCS